MKQLISTTALLLLICTTPAISGSSDESTNSVVTPPTMTPKPKAVESAAEAKEKRAESIRQFQQLLSDNGYYDGPIDGIMTPELRKAAKGWLRDRL